MDFGNVKILFVFHFIGCFFFFLSVLVLRYSYRGEAAGACIAKYQLAFLHACLPVCHFAHLCICAIVHHACQTACFAISPPSSLVILLVDSCHMCLKQSLPSSGLCCLSPPPRSCLNSSHGSCSCANMRLCLPIHMRA